MLKVVNKYCADILSGAIPAGIHLIGAIIRYQKDLLRDDLEFREDAVLKVIQFIRKLKHFTGKHAGKQFTLKPWQMFIVANLYGFYNKDGTRRFQTAYLEMARKNGKTALVAALSLYHLIDDGEEGAEILFTANSLDQSKIGFNMVNGFTRKYDPDARILKQRFKDIYLKNSESVLKVLAADAANLDGYNCSLGIVDEFHSAPNSHVRDVIRSSQGMRENPLLITITTAGFDKSLPCYELRTVCTEVISDIKQDDSLFSVIFSLDEGDNWQNPVNWIKSNPNLEVTVKKSFIKKQVLQAINSPNDEVGVKTKNLNIWCDSATTWIPDDFIVQATEKLDIDDFKGEDCYIGVDLASNTDLTAVSYLFVRGNEPADLSYYFFNDYYIPSDTLKAKNLHADKELYKQWAGNKYLKTTPGNVTDYDYITKDILDVDSKCDIKTVYYDKYNANAWAIQCTEEGLTLEPFSQTIGNFNNCTKSFERLILGGQIVLDDNPITRYCLRNVALRMDFNGNVKPLKSSESKKIDGVIASLQALQAFITVTSHYKGTQIF